MLLRETANYQQFYAPPDTRLQVQLLRIIVTCLPALLKALRSGRSVEEAIEVLMVSSDEDEPDLAAPAQASTLAATQAAQPYDWALAGIPAALPAPDLRIGRSSNVPALPHSQQGSTGVMRNSQPQLGSQGIPDACPSAQPAIQPLFLDTQGSQAGTVCLFTVVDWVPKEII